MRCPLMVALLLGVCSILANADVFAFSFHGSGADGWEYDNPITGDVSGRIEINGNRAVHVWIDSFPSAMGSLPSNDAMTWTSIIANSFTVADGVVTAADFEAMNYRGWAAQFNLDFPVVNNPSHPGGTNYVEIGDAFVSGPNGLGADHINRIATTPEPASVALLGGALFGVAVAVRRKAGRGQGPHVGSSRGV